ncbi:peptide chain release factor N(5)-glutamine methyltransferase [Ekhidna sp.]|uniref:peptide chain release factor N(5)-glutamine methyltransferase n=1 Tax=Ekhidna sp. TaxID=2608089 RepID=UPI0032969308
MQNVKQIWKETAKQLEKVYNRREAEHIAYLLLEDVFKIKRPDILADERREVSSGVLDDLVKRLLAKEPVQYVTGIADFYGRKFEIAPGALIPRPETEELCELVIRENKVLNPKILDVGVGSGCIAVTLALELNGDVFGTDISNDAIAIANKNAAKLQSEINLVKSDILNEVLAENNLDILVSNPPYIPISDQLEMHENVLKYEPELALFVPDNDPIIFYKRIADLAMKSLKRGGKLYFEIHERFGMEVQAYLAKVGYTEIQLHKDMQGKDRMIVAINSTNK